MLNQCFFTAIYCKSSRHKPVIYTHAHNTHLEVAWPWGNVHHHHADSGLRSSTQLNQNEPPAHEDEDAKDDAEWTRDKGISSADCPRMIAAGNGTSFVVTKKGSLVSWGLNNYGVLGHGDTEEVRVPRKVCVLVWRGVVSCDGGGCYMSCCVVSYYFVYFFS
jgi:hypothetical protein